MTLNDKLIVALDVEDLDRAKALIDMLRPLVTIFKIGSPLFVKNGPAAIEIVHERKAKVFLDLKFHDIPNTVALAARFATRLGVFMFNVHTQGGLSMMEEAKKAASEEADILETERPVILGVTVLTSMEEEELKALGIKKDAKEQVLYLAGLAKKAGLDGVVASVKEAEAIHLACTDRFIVVTPGIRPAWSQKQDQKRTATPCEALARGVDYIVIGRPIIEAVDPLKAAKEVIEEIREGVY